MKIKKSKYYDKTVCFLLMVLMSLPLLTNFFGAISLKLFSTTLPSTFSLYVFLFILMTLSIPRLRNGKLSSLFLLYSFILFLFFFNYLVNTKSRIYYSLYLIELVTIFVFYLPIGLLSLYVEKWDYFYRYMKYLAILSPFLTILGIYCFDFQSFLHYMHIGNMLLPGMLFSYYYLRFKKQLKYSIIIILYFYLQLFFGGRMSFFSALFFVVLIEIIIYKHTDAAGKKIFTILIAGFLSIVLFLSQNLILMGFIGLYGLGDSRNIQKIISNELFISRGRQEIYHYAIIALKKLKLGMFGLFGDRIALTEYLYILPYVHNVFFEMWFSFGWIFGSLVILIIIIKIVKNLFLSNKIYVSINTAFYFCLIFLRLLVSSSFIIEGPFFLMVCILFNVYNKKQNNPIDNRFIKGKEQLVP